MTSLITTSLQVNTIVEITVFEKVLYLVACEHIEINAYCNHTTNISSRRNFLSWFQVTMEECLITTLEEC
jgi:hypothetical protein